ncbi:MAG TPA: HD domain-containing phosphohydrolase [Candidatus Polarisedimenticolia bacterium]|nr:HD domain-containing phosphohydrolase [Candidatus Polarisedimenticolia bacterium]
MSQGTIVLVDDNSDSLESLHGAVGEALGREQEILVAHSSEEGLGLLYRIRSDGKYLEMVITKQGLPGIPGTRFLEIVHSQFPGVIKILVSDRPSLEEAVYAFNNAGLDRYIARPWEPEDLKFTVTSLIRQAAMRRTNERLLVDLQKKNAELRDALRELKEAKQEVENSYLSAIQSLAVALEAKDRYTAGHSQRVSRFAMMIARGLDLPAAEVRTIGQIGLLHDIGKIGMDDKVLNKPGKLTKEEFDLIKQHPVIGAQILTPVRSLENHISGIRHHHESWDGTGYPDGLKGEAIPQTARIVCLADSFDAMTSTRPYRPGRTLQEAIQEMRRCAGIQFDGRCVDAFISILGHEAEPDPAESTEPTAATG